jgi:hypothetical protein
MPVYQASRMVSLQTIKTDIQEGLIIRDENGSIIPVDEVYGMLDKIVDGYKILENAQKEMEQPRERKNFLTKEDIKDYNRVLDGWYFEFSEMDEIINYLEVNRIRPDLQLVVATCKAMDGKSFADSQRKLKYFFKTLEDLIVKERKKAEEKILEKRERVYIDKEIMALIRKLYPQGLRQSTTKTINMLFNEFRKSHGLTIYQYRTIIETIDIHSLNKRMDDVYPYVRKSIMNYLNPPVPKPIKEVVQVVQKKELTDEEFARLVTESRKSAAEQRPQKEGIPQAPKKVSTKKMEHLLADIEF